MRRLDPRHVLGLRAGSTVWFGGALGRLISLYIGGVMGGGEKERGRGGVDWMEKESDGMMPLNGPGCGEANPPR